MWLSNVRIIKKERKWLTVVVNTTMTIWNKCLQIWYSITIYISLLHQIKSKGHSIINHSFNAPKYALFQHSTLNVLPKSGFWNLATSSNRHIFIWQIPTRITKYWLQLRLHPLHFWTQQVCESELIVLQTIVLSGLFPWKWITQRTWQCKY